MLIVPPVQLKADFTKWLFGSCSKSCREVPTLAFVLLGFCFPIFSLSKNDSGSPKVFLTRTKNQCQDAAVNENEKGMLLKEENMKSSQIKPGEKRLLQM